MYKRQREACSENRIELVASLQTEHIALSLIHILKLKDNPYRKEITQGLLMALFYEIYDIYQGHAVKERTPKSRCV